MRHYLFAAVTALVMMSSSSASATQAYNPFSDPKFSQVLTPVHAVIAALQTGNSQNIKNLYADDAVVIDDVGSLRWNGATAGADWLSNVTGQWAKFKDAKFTDAQLADISFSGPQKAYAVVYGTLPSKSPDHPFHNNGSFTFTLSKASGDWKITSQTFSPLYGLVPSQQ
jgi:ketosteroid isomerase-like protein